MSDIAKELRERSLLAEQEGEPLALLDEAADEIERLRFTDEERAALEWAAHDASYRGMEWTERVLRGVLKRIG
jgi:hypothetical protein